MRQVDDLKKKKEEGAVLEENQVPQVMIFKYAV